MIILMKLVSIGYDVDTSVLTTLPNVLETAGYVMNPGSVIFGPWLSFNSYQRILEPLSLVIELYCFS